MIDRRKLLKGSAFAAWAPAIVRASSLLPALAATDACGRAQGGGDIYPTGPSLILKPGREFAANSWIHTRLAPNTPLDPNSAAFAHNFNEVLRQTQGAATIENDGITLYIAPPDQPTVKVKAWGVDDPVHGKQQRFIQSKWLDVPMPDPNTFMAAQCPPGVACDSECMIYQPSTGLYYEFFEMNHTGRTTTDSAGNVVREWQATWGGRMGGPGDTNQLPTNPGWWVLDDKYSQGAVATAIPLLAFMVTVGDIEQQAINHPLAISVPQPLARIDVFNSPPAQRTDGLCTLDTCVPEGIVFRLPANLNLDDYPILQVFPDGRTKNVWRLAAEAMQNYGLVVFDTGGFCTMWAENAGTTQYPVNPYDAWGKSGVYFPFTQLDEFPWDKLQALQTNLVSVR